MFCTECGTKLEDGAVFCANCGHKMETGTVTPVAAPVAEPVVETVVAASQSMYSEPASQSMYSEPASQSTYSEPASQSMYSEPASQSMYSEPASQSMYSQPTGQGMYNGANAGQSAYSSANTSQNTYGASNQMNASYNYAGATQQAPKKKGKGCLIAALIGGGILLLLIIVVVVAIIIGVAAFSNSDDEPTDYDDYSYSYDYDYDDYSYDYDYDDYSYDYDYDDYSYDWDDEDVSETTTVSDGSYTIDDITGSWTGTSSLVEVSGASEMQSYLEELYGRSLSTSEVSGLSTATATNDYLEVEVYEYYDSDASAYYPGSWQITLDMGDFFGEQIWDDWDAITYDQFMNGHKDAGCIELDDNNCFYLEVMEKDYIGEYGAQFFDVDDTEVEEDGAYGLVFAGQVSEGSYGPQIEGEIIVMFQYGDMDEPYKMRYEYILDYLYY